MNDLPVHGRPTRRSVLLGRLLGTLLLSCLLGLEARALSVIPPSFRKLVAASEQIVRVEILGSRTQWDQTPSGEKVIHTYLDCRVDQVIKGEAPATLSLRFLGGKVDGVSMVVHDMPALETGVDYLLFIGQNGRAFCPLVAASHGGYRIQKDGATGAEHLLRLDGLPLRTSADVALPLTSLKAGAPDLSGMSPDTLAAAIRMEVDNAR